MQPTITATTEFAIYIYLPLTPSNINIATRGEAVYNAISIMDLRDWNTRVLE